MVLLTSLIALNFVVFEKMNEYKDALELFSDPSQSHLSHLSNLLKEIVEVLDKNTQLMVKVKRSHCRNFASLRTH